VTNTALLSYCAEQGGSTRTYRRRSSSLCSAIGSTFFKTRSRSRVKVSTSRSLNPSSACIFPSSRTSRAAGSFFAARGVRETRLLRLSSGFSVRRINPSSKPRHARRSRSSPCSPKIVNGKQHFKEQRMRCALAQSPRQQAHGRPSRTPFPRMASPTPFKSWKNKAR
jgi:hypothetical protein